MGYIKTKNDGLRSKSPNGKFFSSAEATNERKNDVIKRMELRGKTKRKNLSHEEKRRKGDATLNKKRYVQIDKVGQMTQDMLGKKDGRSQNIWNPNN